MRIAGLLPQLASLGSADLLRVLTQGQKLRTIEMRIRMPAFLDARELDLCTDLLRVLRSVTRSAVSPRCGCGCCCIGVGQFRLFGIGAGRLCEREQGQIISPDATIDSCRTAGNRSGIKTKTRSACRATLRLGLRTSIRPSNRT
jgi:hypothetical protein